MSVNFLHYWPVPSGPVSPKPGEIRVLHPLPSARKAAINALGPILLDHYAGMRIIKKLGGYPKAAKKLRKHLPTKLKTRSGELGEILAVEYVERVTQYRVVVRRLRHKDDREMPMRGDDFVGIHKDITRRRILKGEAKSGQHISDAVVTRALEALAKHRGRPNPNTLSAVARFLRLEDTDDVAEVIEGFQTGTIADGSLEHLVFTLSGNDPTSAFGGGLSARKGIPCGAVGLVADDHQGLVRDVFDAI